MNGVYMVIKNNFLYFFAILLVFSTIVFLKGTGELLAVDVTRGISYAYQDS